MFKPKLEKLTATTTPEKPRQQKPFVQVEGKLTQAQLEAIAGGDTGTGGWGGNHNETMIGSAQLLIHN